MDSILTWVRAVANRAVSPARRHPDKWLLCAVVFIVLLGVLHALLSEGSSEDSNALRVAHDLAINVAAGGIALAVAYGMFWLRFRWHAARRLIARIEEEYVVQSARDPVFARPTLAARLSHDLREQRRSRSVIVVADPGSGRSSFLRAVAHNLATHGHLPILLKGSELADQQTVLQAAKDQFGLLLAAEGQNSQESDRLWESLLRRRKLYVLVDELDAYLAGTIGNLRRSQIHELIVDLHQRGVPFVVALTRRLLTPMPDVQTLRLPQLLPEEFYSYLERQVVDDEARRRLRERRWELAKSLEATQSAYLLDLSIQYAEAAAKGDAGGFASLLIKSHKQRALEREGSWLSEAALLRTRAKDVKDRSAGCLSRLGRKMLLAGADSYPWHAVTQGLSEDQQEFMLLGRAMLERRGIIEVRAHEGAELVSFADPVWLGYSGGLGMELTEKATWPALLGNDTSEPSLKALSVVVDRLGSELPGPPLSVQAVLRMSGLIGVAAEELGVLTAVMNGLLGRGLDERSQQQLMNLVRRAWHKADDEAKLQFLSLCQPSHAPMATFLWQQLSRPDVAVGTGNTYRVRRAIARTIARGGDVVWEHLREAWWEHCQQGLSGDLSSESRMKRHAQTHRAALAHMAWILPALLERAAGNRAEVLELTNTLAQGFMESYSQYNSGEVSGSPDIGLEISLFEGFKMAAVDCWMAQRPASTDLRDLMSDRTKTARAWLSRMSAVHAAALLVHVDSGGEPQHLIQAHEAVGEHPFVRQAARVALRAISAGARARGAIFESVWLDDAETLQSGGAELLDESHGLLAMATVVVNLAEQRGWVWRSSSSVQPLDVDRTGQRIREHVLTSMKVPRCLEEGGRDWRRPGTCVCDFKLCEGELAGSGSRGVSSSFLKRAESTAGQLAGVMRSGSLARRAFRHRAGAMFGQLEAAAADRETAEAARVRAQEGHIW